MSREKRPGWRRVLRWAPALILAAQNVAVFARHYFLGAGFPWDFVGGYYAAPAFWTQAVQNGVFPRWMPYQWLGYPFALNPQTGLFYPPLWLFPLLHAPYTLHAAVVLQGLHVLAGALGMYLLVLSIVRSRREALVAAFAYQLFGGFFSNAEHTDIVRAFALTPWLLWALTARHSDPLVPRRFLAIPPLVLLFATGSYPGATMGAFAVVGAYVIADYFLGERREGQWKRSAVRAAVRVGLVALGCGMAAATLGPPFLFRQEFARVHLEPASRSVLMPVHLSGLVMGNRWLPGDISMTSTFVGLVIVGAVLWSRRSAVRATSTVIAAAVFAWTMGSGSASPVYRGVIRLLPLFGASRFPIADYRGWVAVALIVLGAASLRAARRRPLSGRPLLLRLCLFAAASAWAIVAAEHGHATWQGATAAAVAAAGAAGALLFWQKRRVRLATLPLLAIILVQALDAGRVLGPMRVTWIAPKILDLCRSACTPIAIVHDQGVVVAPGVIEGRPGPRPARLESGRDNYRASGYLLGTFNARDNGNMVLESKRALDATAWTRAYIREPWSPILLDLQDARSPIGWSAPPPGDPRRRRVAGRVQQVRYGLDRILYDVDLSREALVVENEIYFPGWSARVPAAPEEIAAEPANRGLRAWRLPPGRYRMEARFRLPGYARLVTAAVLSGLAWLGTLAVFFRRQRIRSATADPARRTGTPPSGRA